MSTVNYVHTDLGGSLREEDCNDHGVPYLEACKHATPSNMLRDVWPVKNIGQYSITSRHMKYNDDISVVEHLNKVKASLISWHLLMKSCKYC